MTHIHNIHIICWKLGNEPLIYWLYWQKMLTISSAAAQLFGSIRRWVPPQDSLHHAEPGVRLLLEQREWWGQKLCQLLYNDDKPWENVRECSNSVRASWFVWKGWTSNGLSWFIIFFSACKMRYPSLGQNHFEHIQFQWSFHGKSRTKKEHPHVSRSRPGFVSRCFPYRDHIGGGSSID